MDKPIKRVKGLPIKIWVCSLGFEFQAIKNPPLRVGLEGLFVISLFRVFQKLSFACSRSLG